MNFLEGQRLRIGARTYLVTGADTFGVKLKPGNLALTVDGLLQHVQKGELFFHTQTGLWPVTALHNGVLQLTAPTLADVTTARLSELGGLVRVRLKGREAEGLFNVTHDERGQLTANSNDSQTAPFTITPDQVQAHFVDDVSPDIGPVRVDSRKKVEAQRTTGADASLVHATRPEGAPVIQDDEIGSTGVGTEIVVGRGDEILSRLTQEIEQLEGPIFSMMYDLDEQGPAEHVVNALIAKAPAQVRIGLNPSKPLTAELRARFEQGGVTLFEVELRRDIPTIVHQKLLTSRKRSFVSSAPIIGHAVAKIEALAVLPPVASGLVHEYADLSTRTGSNAPRRRDVMRQLAEHGVVINDPNSDVAYASRAVNGLIRGANRSLDIWVDELRASETTNDLITQAKRGVIVTLRVRTLDPASAKLITDAKAAKPDLPLDVGVFELRPDEPYPHLNVIVADDAQAYFGTMFLWKGQLSLLEPTGTSFESGVVLDGERLVALRDGLRQMLPDALWKPST